MANKIEIPRKVTYVVGCYWGDEGKGRVTSYCAKQADVIVRATGGNNAGHTVVVDDREYALHLLPSGIVEEEKICVIGPAVLVDPEVLINEIEMLSKDVSISPERLKISGCCHVILPYHKEMDKLHEIAKGDAKVGTTGRGIGPCEADKRNRIGLRLYDLLRPRRERIKILEVALKLHNIQFKEFGMDTFSAEEMSDLCERWAVKLHPYICDTDMLMAYYVEKYNNILIEGAQAFLLDIEHGMYPMVTSTSPNGAGTMSGAGIGPIYAARGIGVIKAYCSKVGNGFFPTEEPAHIKDDKVIPYDKPYVGDQLREAGHEYGTTTGRPRRCGNLDLCILRSAKTVMGLSELCLNHLDTIGKYIQKYGSFKVCVSYSYMGETICMLPADLNITKAKPIPDYIEFKEGWDTTGCKTYEELPDAAKDFICFIEKETGIPVTMIGIGPSNEDTIIRY